MKKIILAVMAILALNVTTPLMSQAAFAACPGTGDAQNQVLVGIDETGNGCDGSGVKSLINTIVTVLSFVVGIAAIIAIIVSGFKYITSGGDSAKVTSAKNTLIYALIGIAIAALAQFLVHFAFNAAVTSTEKPCSTPNTHRSANGKECVPDKP